MKKHALGSVFVFSVLAASGFGQTLNNSTLNGAWYMRHVQFTTDSNNNIIDARSIVGTITFDGGVYSFTGQQVIGTGAPATYSFSGSNGAATYTVTAAGLVTLANPQTNNHQINARYSAEAIIGSSTDNTGNTFDLFVAIPARAANATPVYSDQTLTVNYHMADFELTNASTAQVRTSGMAAEFDGAGNIQTFRPLGHVASFASGATQTSEEFTGAYTVANDGTGTIAFSPVAGTTTASNLLLAGATRNLYVSATGNVFFAATPGAHDILIGVQNAATDSISFSGRYWYAGIEANADGTSADLVASASVIPGANTLLLTARQNQAPAVVSGLPNTTTATRTLTYTTETNGFGNGCGCGIGSAGNVVTIGDTFVLGGNNGTVVSVTTGQDGNGNPLNPTDFQIFFGEQIPNLTGTGVFVNPQGIVNASTYAPVGDSISPGEFIQIYGSNLAPSHATAGSLPFPPNLNGVSVSINGVAAPLYDVRPGQITCIVPYELTGMSATIIVTNSGAASNPVTVGASLFSPGVFAANQLGYGDGAITHGQGALVNTLVNAASPALPNEAVQMYVSGLGSLTTPVADGNGFDGIDNANVQPVVLVNGTPATVFYAGLTPDAGLYLIDFYVPPGTPNGEQPVTVAAISGSAMFGTAALTSTITLAVQTPVTNPTLTITTSGTGSGTVATIPTGTSCGTGCLSFSPETVVTLTPTPATGSTFAGWAGACSGSSACSVTVSSNLSANAIFNVAVNPTLTITTLGSGAGTVASSPPGTSCGPGCLSFAPGTAVSLTPTPASGSTFSGWSNTCTGTTDNQICNLTINSGQMVTAVFNLPGFVGGTAATGSPIAGANVTLKDSTGKSSAATTNANGAYALSTAGMTPPFLVQVQTANGNLYSVSADALTTTTINTHPFTDLIIRSWYNAQGQSIDTAFSNPASMPAPGPANVQLLLNAITTLAQLWLGNAGVNTVQFNLISSPFLANGAGLDQVLDESTVNASTGAVTISAGGTTQTATLTWNTSSSTINVTSTTTNSTSSSVSSSTTVIPTQTAQQAALDSILTTLTGFFDAVATNGSQLTADELTPFMAADLVNDGLNQSQLAASLATSWRGAAGGTVEFETVRSIDLVNGIADVVINQKGSEFWFEDVAGTWLIGGDNRIAAINLSSQADTYEGAQSGAGPQVNVKVLAPQGTVTGVTVTGASAITGFNSTNAPQGATSVQNFRPTPTTQLSVDLSSFNLLTGFLGNNLVPPGTPFTFAITPASGPAVTYTVLSNVFTTDPVTITSPTSGTLSSYTLGEPLAVQWTLPTTFPVVITGVGALTYTGPENSPSSLVCHVDGVSYSLGSGSPYTTLVNATSGTVTIPTTCDGLPVLSVVVNVNASGANGEAAFSSLAIR